MQTHIFKMVTDKNQASSSKKERNSER